jgi:hypothetical protein
MGFARLGLCILGLTFVYGRAFSNTPAEIVENIEHNDKQSVLAGHTEGFSFSRGNAQFEFGPGELTLFDFGAGRIAAMTYVGQGTFQYAPPNEVEKYQVRRFVESDTIDDNFEKLTLFFTVELEPFADTSALIRTGVSKLAWNQLSDAAFDEFDHTWVNITNDLIGDLSSEGPGTYLNAYFQLKTVGNMVFIENPISDDLFMLIKLVSHSGSATSDYISGYSPDNDLPSLRGIAPIDILKYDINSKIKGNGNMLVDCWIHYQPLRWGRRQIYFSWYNDNKLLSACDSDGDTLMVVRKKKKGGLISTKMDEGGFGLILEKPLQIGVEDSIYLTYECKSLENIYGMFAISGKTAWYPQNVIWDAAIFDMQFDCPKPFELISCGNLVESRIENDHLMTHWRTDKPINYASFNIGDFETKDFIVPDLPVVRVFISKTFPHSEYALLLAEAGILSSGNMMGSVGADVTNSLAFYGSILGPCPFDTIRAVELLFSSEGQGSPGLIHLSYGTFQTDDIGGYDEAFRAHEVAHQWWGHVIDNESYRDTWIIEGLAEYSGAWFYQMSNPKKDAFEDMLKEWRLQIKGSEQNSDGYKAGPVVMGPRLSSTKSEDYVNIVYEKGGYIYHMIRYLMHDYKTGSDDAFAAFLKDLAVKYKGKIITTEKLRALLEDHIGGDMGWFFDQWVYGTEIPKYIFSSKWEKTLDGKYDVICHVKQEDVADGFQMIVPITVLFDDEKYVHLKILVDQPESDIELPLLPYKPKKIIFNTFDAVLCEVTYK